MKFIPVNRPIFIGNESKYIMDCIKSGYVSSEGVYVKKFEKKFAHYIGKKYAISVSNGTAALQIAYDSLGLKKDSEVILPAFTIISCIMPVIRSGGKPILVDVDRKTWNLDIKLLEKKITSKTKCIIAPHMYGLPIDMAPLKKIAKKKKIFIIEDAAEVLGLKYKNRQCGSFGDISTFSFYANKHITTGEGGMIVTDSPKLAEKCRLYRNLYFNTERRFKHYELGWNSRFTNIQAAVGLGQLETINKFIKKKRIIGKKYKKEILDNKNFDKPLAASFGSENIYWVYGLVLKNKLENKLKKIMKILKENNIDTRNFFYPLNKQPVLNKIGMFKNEKYPNAEYIAENGFYIPSGLGTSLSEQNRVIKIINKTLTNEQ